jgi:hypothetical protein
VQPLWTGELPQRSIEEVLQTRAANSQWSKELRKQLTVLVDSRLAKRISQDEYELDRQQHNLDTAECKRRQMLLDNELTHRDKPWLAAARG